MSQYKRVVKRDEVSEIAKAIIFNVINEEIRLIQGWERKEDKFRRKNGYRLTVFHLNPRRYTLNRLAEYREHKEGFYYDHPYN